MTVGRTIVYRGREYLVIGTVQIVNHGDKYTNTLVTHELYVKGKRGAIYRGWLYTSGHLELNILARAFSHFVGSFVYDGTTGQRTVATLMQK